MEFPAHYELSDEELSVSGSPQVPVKNVDAGIHWREGKHLHFNYFPNGSNQIKYSLPFLAYGKPVSPLLH
jgi:hypothetical protein